MSMTPTRMHNHLLQMSQIDWEGVKTSVAHSSWPIPSLKKAQGEVNEPVTAPQLPR